MRLVYMPVISARNVQASSSYNFWLALRRAALAQDPTHTFYVVVPKITPESRWQEGADWSGPRTHVIEVPMAEMQYDDAALVTREFWERFNERFGDLYFDVILSERPILAPMLDKLTTFHLVSKSRRPVIVSRDQFTPTAEIHKITRQHEMLQAVGWASAPTVFQSPQQAKRALGVARKHLTPAHVQRIEETMRVIPLGIDCADIDETNMVERSQKHDEITVNYSHKLFIEQKFLESLKIMDSTYAGGRPIRLQVVTGSSPMKFHMLPRARQYAYMEIHGNQNRSQFLRQMARAHVFISNSYYEDFSATIAEQIYTGLAPVMFDADWSRYLVGDDYPYLFRDMSEGQAMLRFVVDHYAEIRDEWVPRLQDRCRKMFDLATIIPEFMGWLTQLHEQRLAGLKAASRPLREVIQAAYEDLPDEFGLEEFYAAIKANATALDVTNQKTESRATSPWLCVDVLRHLHPSLVDTGDLHVRFRVSE